MKQAETYIAVDTNGKIIGIYQTVEGLDKLKKTLMSTNVKYEQIYRIPNDNEAVTGMHYKELDSEGRIKPLVDRIKEGLATVPKGFKLVGNELIEKTTIEKIEDKEIELKENEIFDEQTGVIREKTLQEMYTEEEIRRMELELLISEEIRRITRREVLESLKQKGLLTEEDIKILEMVEANNETN